MRKVGSRGRSAAREIAYIGLGTALVTVCAWIAVPVSAIPVTLQTLAVALVGALLGWRGVASVAVYLVLGLVGIPVFSEFRAGSAALFGTTGGYLFGFLFLAAVPAIFKRIPVQNKWARGGLFYLSMAIGLAVCYFFGTVWFVVSYQCGVAYALTVCVVPYLIPDFVKFLVAAYLAVRLEKYLS